MASVLDLLSQADQIAPPQAPPDTGGVGESFHQGLRSGAYGVGANLNALAGLAGETVGADNFAQGRHAEEQRMAQEAQASAPRVHSYKDVHGLRDAFDYASGLAGGAIPAVGAGLAGGIAGGVLSGGNPLGAIAGSTLAFAPIEAGDVVQRQQADPAVMASTTPGERLLRAGGTGLASSALMNIVPGAVMGRIASGAVGRTGALAARDAFEAAPILPRMAGELAAGTGGMTAAEGAKQFGANPDAPLDTEALKEAAVGGAVSLAPLVGSAGVASAASRALRTSGNVLSRTAELGKEKAVDAVGTVGDKATDAAQVVTDKAKEVAASDPVQALRETAKAGVSKVRAMWDNIAKGEEAIDPDALVGATPEQARATLEQQDVQRTATVTDAFKALVADPSLSPETRDTLIAAGSNLADKANQAVVATVQKGKNFVDGMKDFANNVAKRADEINAGAKKSEDYQGFEAALAEHVVPVLHEIAPGFETDPALLANTGRALRTVIDSIRKGGKAGLSSDDVAGLIDLFGPHTMDVMDATYRAMGDIDSAQRAKVVEGLSFVRDFAAAKQKLEGFMAGKAKPGTGADVKADAEVLRKWADTTDGAKAFSPAERAYKDARLKDELGKRYDDVDAILKAVEKDRADVKGGIGKNVMEDESKVNASDKTVGVDEGKVNTNRDGEELVQREASKQVATHYYGTGEDKTGLVLNPDHPEFKGNKEANQVTSATVKAKADHPNKDVSFRTAEELGMDHPSVKQRYEEIRAQLDERHPEWTNEKLHTEADKEVRKYGMVVAEGERAPGELTHGDLHGLRLVSKEGDTYTHPSGFKVGDRSYDAMKLVTRMSRDFPRGESNLDKTDQHRAARLFAEGIAAMSDRLGEAINPPDKTAIMKRGTEDGKPMYLTWGEAKKLGFAPKPEGEAAALHTQLAGLRAEYSDARAQAKTEPRFKAVMDNIMRGAQHIHDELVLLDTPEITKTVDGIGVHGKEFSQERADNIKKLRGQLRRLETELNSRTRDNPEFLAKGREMAGLMDKKLTRLEREDAASVGGVRDTMQQERDPFGNIHAAGKNVEPIDVNPMSGIPTQGRVRGVAPPDEATRWKTIEPNLRAKFEALVEKRPSAAAAALGEKGIALLDNIKLLNDSAKKSLEQMLHAKRTADIESTLNAMYTRYSKRFEQTPEKATVPTMNIDSMVGKEDYAAVKTTADADAFVKAAGERFGELKRKSDARTDAEDDAYYRLKEMFGEPKNSAGEHDLSMFYKEASNYKGEPISNADVRAKFNAASEVAASTGPKESLDRTRKGAITDEQKQRVNDYLDKVLGPQLKREFADIPHAGEFDSTQDVVRVSVHALNPTTVAYHEALHALFSRLMDQGNGKVAETLMRVARTEPVLNQLRRLLEKSPDAIRQLADPEEAAAYMYQAWAAGELKLGTEAKTIMQRIGDIVKKALGIWSDSDRAEEIMRYFHEGEFKANQNDPSAIAAALIERGHNRAIETAKTFTKPLLDVAERLALPAATRMRGARIPALREIADAMMLERHGSGRDAGFLPEARHRRTQIMNDFAEKLGHVDDAVMNEALEAMQNGTKTGLSAEAARVVDLVQGDRGLLPRMWQYMSNAGVDMSVLVKHGINPKTGKAIYERHEFHANPDYFPRVYSTDAIGRNTKAFMAVLEKHGVADARKTMNAIIANEGNAFAVVDRPGMQFLKSRELRFIPDTELAPYMQKDLSAILSSYVTQTTRRAEWTKRMGANSEVFYKKLAEAKAQGATPAQLKMAEDFIRAADGTLGDTMTPEMRRLQGNVLVYQNIRLLPLMLFSNIIDPMGIVVRGGGIHNAFDAWKRNIKEIGQAWKKEYKADADTKLAEMIGTIDNASLGHAMSDIYMQGMVGDTGKKINNAFFRYNFTEGTNRAMRVAATRAAIEFLNKHADGTYNQHSTRYLEEVGLRPGEWDGDLTKARNKAAVNRWVDGAVLRPETADTPMWMADPRYMLIAHLKRFVYAFQETIIKRVMHEAAHGNYTPAMALASYVPIMIAADTAKGFIMGGGSQPSWKKDWGVGDYVASGVERAGLLGMGQFAVDAATGNFGSLTGPTIEQLILDPIKVAYKRESPSQYAEEALPAHALYQGFLKPKEARADPMFAD